MKEREAEGMLWRFRKRHKERVKGGERERRKEPWVRGGNVRKKRG